MITIFNQKIKQVFFWLVLTALVVGVSCKKGTFDINSPSPNSLSPGVVPPKYYLSSSLAATANLMFTGANGSQYGIDLLNTWMGYWAVSGGYTPSTVLVTYQLTSGTGSGNWDDAYLNLKNYQLMRDLATSDSTLANYKAISMVMQAFVFQRIVDLYNNAPYTGALQDGRNFSPSYDNGSNIYKGIVSKIDSAVNILKANLGNANVENPGKYDVLFKGDMSKWLLFANTVKLKILMRLTATSDGPAFISSELAGLTPGNFLGPDQNAGVNPGYSTASNAQENPYYLDVAFTVTGSIGTNGNYWRANSYAVNFYASNNDPRAAYFYVPNKAGKIQGRKIGSTAGNEGNDFISAVNGAGNAKSPSQDAVILGAFESFFLQAEAISRGYIIGDAKAAYKSGVIESFKQLGTVLPPIKSVVDPTKDSITYSATSSAQYYLDSGANKTNSNVNWDAASDKIKLIITQKWAACNSFDPLESYSDWRRLKFPSDLPVSDYPGSQATHIPYRLLYPVSESSYNSANLSKQGNIDIFNSKVFWQP